MKNEKAVRELFEKYVMENSVYCSTESTAWPIWQEAFRQAQQSIELALEVCDELIKPYSGNPDDMGLSEIQDKAKDALMVYWEGVSW